METLNLDHWVSEFPFHRYEQASQDLARPKKFLQTKAVDPYKKQLDYQGIQRTAVLNEVNSSPKSNIFNVSKAFVFRNLSFAELIHPRWWSAITSINLHASSQKVVKNQSFCLILDALFEIISNQHPTKVRNRRSLATFNLIKGSLVGSKVMLRNQNKVAFLYKWYFLCPQYAPSIVRYRRRTENSTNFLFSKKPFKHTLGLGIEQVFIFQELDRLDYEAFSQVPGFDMVFAHTIA